VLPRLDETLLRAMLAPGHGPLWLAARVFSALGDGWSMLAILPLVFVPRTRRLAIWLVLTLALTALVVVSMKALVARGRPVVACADLAATVCNSPTDPSYPSGHAAGSFAFALFSVRALLDGGPRLRYARELAVGCVVFAACVGVSRVVLGAHFPSDVVAGTILGSTAGAIAGRRFTSGRAAAARVTSGSARAHGRL
jgi:undecaprenyl-diphosphatase